MEIKAKDLKPGMVILAGEPLRPVWRVIEDFHLHGSPYLEKLYDGHYGPECLCVAFRVQHMDDGGHDNRSYPVGLTLQVMDGSQPDRPEEAC